MTVWVIGLPRVVTGIRPGQDSSETDRLSDTPEALSFRADKLGKVI